MDGRAAIRAWTADGQPGRTRKSMKQKYEGKDLQELVDLGR
jgi:hypothetical protein